MAFFELCSLWPEPGASDCEEAGLARALRALGLSQQEGLAIAARLARTAQPLAAARAARLCRELPGSVTGGALLSCARELTQFGPAHALESFFGSYNPASWATPGLLGPILRLERALDGESSGLPSGWSETRERELKIALWALRAPPEALADPLRFLELDVRQSAAIAAQLSTQNLPPLHFVSSLYALPLERALLCFCQGILQRPDSAAALKRCERAFASEEPGGAVFPALFERAALLAATPKPTSGARRLGI